MTPLLFPSPFYVPTVDDLQSKQDIKTDNLS